MSTLPKSHLTPEEYLKIERKAEYKSEYYGGEMFAMSGARRAHNLIAMNVGSGLHDQLRRRSCEVYPSDMRVRVNATGLYTYPDVVVVCSKPEFADDAMDALGFGLDPVERVLPRISSGPSGTPRLNDMKWILPPSFTSTSQYSESALTHEMPTPCRPPATL